MAEIVSLPTPCSKCQGQQMTCKFNYFHQGDLEIHSWEHKCPDCGHRQTIAYRSDDEDLDTPREDRSQCPYCGRAGAP